MSVITSKTVPVTIQPITLESLDFWPQTPILVSELNAMGRKNPKLTKSRHFKVGTREKDINNPKSPHNTSYESYSPPVNCKFLEPTN